MKTFSALSAFVRGMRRWPVTSPHKGQLRGALMFSLIYTWTNGWVNNRRVSYLRRHRAHYDVTVMGGKSIDRLRPQYVLYYPCLIYKIVAKGFGRNEAEFWRAWQRLLPVNSIICKPLRDAIWCGTFSGTWAAGHLISIGLMYCFHEVQTIW